MTAHPTRPASRRPADRDRIAYTVAEVAALLGKHPNTVYGWVQRGALPVRASSAARSTSPSGRWPG